MVGRHRVDAAAAVLVVLIRFLPLPAALLGGLLRQQVPIYHNPLLLLCCCHTKARGRLSEALLVCCGMTE